MGPAARIARRAVLTAYFSLLPFLVAWYAWLAPSRYFPVSMSLLFMVGPLLLPLRGLLAGRPYTHAWTSFLALFYFAHGVSQAWTIPEDRWYGTVEALLSAILFCGAVLYARFRGRELRAPDSVPSSGQRGELER
jgi:uncharacterized membrane protein